jgi:hypothetical protein
MKYSSSLAFSRFRLWIVNYSFNRSFSLLFIFLLLLLQEVMMQKYFFVEAYSKLVSQKKSCLPFSELDLALNLLIANISTDSRLPISTRFQKTFCIIISKPSQEMILSRYFILIIQIHVCVYVFAEVDSIILFSLFDVLF